VAQAADAAGGEAAVTLRPGLPKDAPALARIHRMARAVALPGLCEPWGEAAVADWLRGTLLAHHRVRVAVVAGSPVAYLGLAHAGASGAEVLHLYVAPGFQGRGIGGRLLVEAIAAAPGGLALFAFERNQAARRFSGRHGFRIADARAASANEEGEPDLRYVRAPHAEPNQTEEREP
jgi:GNAT superfamily N-acetyltransferase